MFPLFILLISKFDRNLVWTNKLYSAKSAHFMFQFFYFGEISTLDKNVFLIYLSKLSACLVCYQWETLFVESLLRHDKLYDSLSPSLMKRTICCLAANFSFYLSLPTLYLCWFLGYSNIEGCQELSSAWELSRTSVLSNSCWDKWRRMREEWWSSPRRSRAPTWTRTCPRPLWTGEGCNYNANTCPPSLTLIKK